MQMTQLTLKPALLAMSLMVLSIPAHSGVYKWIDEEGHVHYSEQPPNNGSHTQLHVKAAPNIPQTKSIYSSDPMTAHLCDEQAADFSAQQCEIQRQREAEKNRMLARQQADTLASQQRNKADQQRLRDMEEEKASREKAQNDALVADCNRNREVYCDKGVAKIKSEKAWREFEEEIARRKRNSHGY